MKKKNIYIFLIHHLAGHIFAQEDFVVFSYLFFILQWHDGLIVVSFSSFGGCGLVVCSPDSQERDIIFLTRKSEQRLVCNAGFFLALKNLEYKKWAITLSAMLAFFKLLHIFRRWSHWRCLSENAWIWPNFDIFVFLFSGFFITCCFLQVYELFPGGRGGETCPGA